MNTDLYRVGWDDFRVAQERSQKNFKVLESEADRVLQIGKENGWQECRFFTYAEMIERPIVINGWKLFPADQFEDAIPVEGMKRIHKLINSGVKIKGLVVADDGRRTAPRSAQQSAVHQTNQPNIAWGKIGAAAMALVGGLVLAVAGIFAAVIAAAVLAPLLFMAAIPAALLYDPLLICVLESGDWIVCYEWLD